jgi:hypothetical protein
MQLALSARDRRTLVIGVSVVGSLFALGRGLPALMSWQSTRIADATATVGDLTDARAGRRALPTLRDSAREQQARIAAIDSAIVTAPTSSAAAALLASALEEMADEARVKVGAMQLVADSAAAGAVVQVGVRLTGVADVYGLLELLKAVEGGEALLAVRELAVSQSDPAAPSTKPEALRIDMMVVGMARIAADGR